MRKPQTPAKAARSRRPELVVEIHDQLADAFTKRGMPAENVQVYAGLAVEALIDLLGGRASMSRFVRWIAFLNVMNKSVATSLATIMQS